MKIKGDAAGLILGASCVVGFPARLEPIEIGVPITLIPEPLYILKLWFVLPRRDSQLKCSFPTQIESREGATFH